MNEETRTYHSRASSKHKYLTVAVPKVGCTTIKRTLHALEGLPPADPWWDVHDAAPELRLSHYSAREVDAMLTSADYLRFAIVRNPYDRMLSAWKSKIYAPTDTQYAPLRARIRDEFAYPDGGDDSLVVAFGDFVRFVTSHRHSDGHWNTQSHVLACDDISYDVIGHFENFVEDFRAILERLDAPPAVLAIAAQVTNPTTELPNAAAYDSELAAVVYDYYREDFERFDYYRDSWLMPAPRP